MGLFGFGWWNSANALETTIDYSVQTGSEAYLHLIGNTFERNADGDSINPNPNFLNELYDDEGWWALAWIFMRNLAALYQESPRPAYRDFIVRNADSIFANATSEYGEIGLMWYAPFDRADPIRQSSGLDAINAALAAQQP